MQTFKVNMDLFFLVSTCIQYVLWPWSFSSHFSLNTKVSR